MITDSFDITTESVTSPEAFLGPRGHEVDVCIVTFSRIIAQEVQERFECVKIGEIPSCNGRVPVVAFTCGGRRFGFYLSHLGSACASNDIIEAGWISGATKFVVFGSAGSLDREATVGKYVIPTAACRDEGMSYHYAPPADYITVRGAETVESVLREAGAPYVLGRTWTTDAFYRETRALIAKHRAEGCLAVEMEIAGMQAVCDFYGYELYDFLQTGDVLDSEEYESSGLHEANHRLANFDLALKIAERIAK